MYKTFDPSRDIANQISVVNESIVFGGSVFSGAAGGGNTKRYIHWISASVSGGYYQGVYNTTFSDAAAIELFDIAYGVSVSSSVYSDTATVQKQVKNRVYRLFAKQLLGSEAERFTIGSNTEDDLIFISIRRSQFKDEIKKGTVSIIASYSGSFATGHTVVEFDQRNFSDSTAQSTFSETIRGDVAPIKTGSVEIGKIYYQAGVVVLAPGLVSNTSSITTNIGNEWSGSFDYQSLAASANLDNINHAIRHRFKNLTFVNKSNLHSTFYFCRALNDEFNYSSNPTFTDSSGRIIPTSGTNDLRTLTYITRVGLLGDDGEVLAVASVSQPIKKTPEEEILLKVRLDY